MSNKSHIQANLQASYSLKKEITATVLKMAYPTTTAHLWELVQAIFPIISKYRKIFYNNAVREMHENMQAKGLEITPVPSRLYSPHATWKMIAYILGWNPTPYPLHAPVDAYPKEFQETLENTLKLAPTASDHEKLARRVAGAAYRHAASAGRDVVADSARESPIRDARTKEVVRSIDLQRPDDNDYDGSNGGVNKIVVGWARVLTGEENCPFCAMLASRGPVYDKNTVLSAASREGRRYHDFCDCIAVMVVKGEPWEGQEQYEQLQDLWYSADSEPTDEEIFNKLSSTQQRFYHRYRREFQVPPHPGITLDQNEKGSAVVIPPDVLAEVDDGGDHSWLANMSADVGAQQPESHEWITFIRLAQNGHHIHLRKTSDQSSPDVWLDGVLTECKTPHGSTKNTIANNLKAAKHNFDSFKSYDGRKQVVIDCHRCPLDDDRILREAKENLSNPRFELIDQLIILRKNGQEEVLRR